MHKSVKIIVLTLASILFLQQVAFAAGETERPPKPTEGIESNDPNHGSSKDIQTQSPESITGLFYDYYCTIDNGGTFLYCEGATKSFNVADEIRLNLYLQKWDGSQWVDIQNWNYTRYDVQSITEGGNYYSYQHGFYYRTRAEHYIKSGSQSETRNSTSPYIYVQ